MSMNETVDFEFGLALKLMQNDLQANDWFEYKLN